MSFRDVVLRLAFFLPVTAATLATPKAEACSYVREAQPLAPVQGAMDVPRNVQILLRTSDDLQASDFTFESWAADAGTPIAFTVSSLTVGHHGARAIVIAPDAPLDVLTRHRLHFPGRPITETLEFTTGDTLDTTAPPLPAAPTQTAGTYAPLKIAGMRCAVDSCGPYDFGRTTVAFPVATGNEEVHAFDVLHLDGGVIAEGVPRVSLAYFACSPEAFGLRAGDWRLPDGVTEVQFVGRDLAGNASPPLQVAMTRECVEGPRWPPCEEAEPDAGVAGDQNGTEPPSEGGLSCGAIPVSAAVMALGILIAALPRRRARSGSAG